jgi:acetoin utilization deacetylase AcuC-like enzyme
VGCSFVYSPEYYCDIGPHVFPMVKFELLHRALRGDGDIPDDCFLRPEPATLDDLRLVYTPEYVADLCAGRHTSRTIPSELPITEQIVRSFVFAAGGSILACRQAMREGLSMNLTGGFHHAFPDHAEGFCYINDVAVAIRRLQMDGTIGKAAVVDLDVHQGNGTAFTFQDDPSVFTFSMHQENNYPVKRRSTVDVGLADGVGDEEYLKALRSNLRPILDEFQPQLIVYIAGTDVFAQDQLGGLRMTLDGMAERDRTVIHACRERGLPLAVVLGGGYATRLEDTVRAHHNTAHILWESRGIGPSHPDAPRQSTK